MTAAWRAPLADSSRLPSTIGLGALGVRGGDGEDVVHDARGSRRTRAGQHLRALVLADSSTALRQALVISRIFSISSPVGARRAK